MGVIYCYTNLINNKKYIGQTINPKQRYRQHKSSAFNENDKDYNSLIHRAFRKYGYDNFKYEILAQANDIEVLNQLEIYYIKKYNTKVPYGYNIEDGGKNCSRPMTEEQKEKLMKSHASLTEEEVIELRLAYQRGESPKIIYDQKYKNRLHYNAFLNIWSGQRYKTIMPEAIQKGRHTKLNKEIVQSIRNDREILKLTYKQLAKKYKISSSTIADIIKRRTWKNV